MRKKGRKFQVSERTLLSSLSQEKTCCAGLNSLRFITMKISALFIIAFLVAIGDHVGIAGAATGKKKVARSLKEIEHVIIFMQENRSFNTVCHQNSSRLLHSLVLRSPLTVRLQYFGTMAGTRGFNDPNVQVNPDGLPVWYQSVALLSGTRPCLTSYRRS